MDLKKLLALLLALVLVACSKDDDLDNPGGEEPPVNENPAAFAEIGMIDIGGEGAAEITAYDPLTQRLFVVNNSDDNKIDVIDFQNPAQMNLIGSIELDEGAVNSLAVHDGKLAAAIEADQKQQPGKVIVYNTDDYQVIRSILVGALPDMVIFSPDGNYILTANEGEPSSDYQQDPPGTVSIISVQEDYSVADVDFSPFESQLASLEEKGLRVFGPDAGFAEDMEPEYIAVSPGSKTAWVTLQENNAIAKIDLGTKTVTDVFPLGFKDYEVDENAIDPGDKDGEISFKPYPVRGIYQPDAIAVMEKDGIPYLFTANEGDVREYDAYEEAERVKDLQLDPASFPDAAALQQDNRLGRLDVTTALGDTDGDGDYDLLYSFGARSFSTWNGHTGELVFDSKNELETICAEAGIYDDGRSDNKGVEPEGLTIGLVNDRYIIFAGMERSDAVAVYDVTNPENPAFLQLLNSGDAPEGLLFIPAGDSPLQQSLLVVSSEDDGIIKVYMPDKL